MNSSGPPLVSDLSPSQREKVDTLKAVTGISSDQQAVNILHGNAWDIESAVNIALIAADQSLNAHRPAVPSASSSSSSARPASSSSSSSSSRRLNAMDVEEEHKTSSSSRS